LTGLKKAMRDVLLDGLITTNSLMEYQKQISVRLWSSAGALSFMDLSEDRQLVRGSKTALTKKSGKSCSGSLLLTCSANRRVQEIDHRAM
jgi:hypothetical protein